ncbi:diacylglyceryl transferase [Clostridium perfringens]|uniref:diacylglyceryl transferase n=1 Tax=Clostridium perfringens TaxID=1502 RepID=UPI0039EA500D
MTIKKLREYLKKNKVVVLSVLLIASMFFGIYKSTKVYLYEKRLEEQLKYNISKFAYATLNSNGEERNEDVYASMKACKEVVGLWDGRGGYTDNEITLLRAFCNLEYYWKVERERIELLLSNNDFGWLIYDISMNLENSNYIKDFIDLINGDVKPKF